MAGSKKTTTPGRAKAAGDTNKTAPRTGAAKKDRSTVTFDEERLRSLLDTTAAWIWTTDGDLRHTYTNAFVTKYLGYPVDEFLQMNMMALIHPDDQGVVKELMEQARTGGAGWSDVVLQWRHQDGTWRHLESNGSALFDAQGTFIGLQGVDRDITERLQIEAALRESEERYRQLFDAESDAIFLIENEGGRLLAANDAATVLYGYDKEELLGLRNTDLSAEPSATRQVTEGTPIMKDNAVTIPLRYHRKKDGTVFPVEITGRFFTYQERAVHIAAIRDITERHRAEEMLRESELQTRSIIESLPLGMHMYRLEPDNRLVFVGANPAADRILGVDNRLFIGKTIEEAFPALKDSEVPKRYREAAASGKAWNTESIDYQEGAIAGAFEVHAFPTGPDTMVAAFEDITERKRNESALKASEENYRRLYNDTPVLLHSIDRNAVVVEVNDFWLKTLGYERHEVIGRKVVDFYTEASRKYAAEVVQPAFFRDGTVKDVPYQFVKKNGEVVDVLLSATAERDAAGNVVRSQAVTIDVTERKQAEAALQKSEKMLQTIIDAEPECVKLLDENANLIMMNRAGLDMLQVESLDQVKGQCVCPMVTSEYRQDFLDLTKRIFQGESGTLLFEMVGLKGRHLWMETHAVPLRNEEDEITALLGVTRDVTERKRAEEEARRNETRMASLYRISQSSVEDEQAFLDLALHEAISLTGSAIGYLYFYDEAKREFTLNSYSRDVMQECAIAERKTCYELDRTGLWGEAVRQRRPILLNDFESDHPQKKGYPEGHARLRKFLTVPVIMEGSVVAVVGVANKPENYTDADVLQLNLLMDSVWKMIQRARAERALQESEERFRTLAESLPLTVFEIDLQGRFTYLNRAALETFGYSRQEFDAGLTMAQMIAPGDRDRAREAAARRLAGNEDRYREYLGLRKDGTTFPVTVALGPILRDGSPIGLRGIVSDLSERKQLEDEMLKSQKLESLGTLAGGIAHDFNNLLQGVFGYISLAKLSLDQRAKSIAALEQAEKALHQSVSLTSQLLTFSKGGKPVKKVVDLKPVIENAARFALSGSRVDLRLSVADDLRHVEADAGQIGQVIQNLVLNADQAMPLGGRIELSARNVPVASPAGLPAGLAGDLVEITMRDAGTGIPPEHLARIFDPYFTTKEKGSGLGLATSYSIIRNHGGLITVSSEMGKGSLFTIYLPASSTKTEPAAPSGACSLGQSCRVLVMDDDAVVRDVAAALLGELGHEVEVAEHGEAAIETYQKAKDSGRPFDLVILDLTVRGGMGGAETIKKLREVDPNVKAVASSGYSDDDIGSTYQQRGFRAFLSKPYSIDALSSMLQKMLT